MCCLLSEELLTACQGKIGRGISGSVLGDERYGEGLSGLVWGMGGLW